MDHFTKLVSSITESTIWEEDHETRIVWITMLAMADPTGYVGASVPGLAGRARVSVEAVERALAKFLSPDKYSRTKEHEGRRIVEADRGWVLLNYLKFREARGREVRKEQNRAAQAKRRAREKLTTADVSADLLTTKQSQPRSAQEEEEAEAEILPVVPPGLPDEPAPERSTIDVVRAEYSQRFLAARATPPGWGRRQVEHLRAVAAWVDEMGGDAERITARLMDGFFRDRWAVEKAFPLGALASNPSKYLGAAGGPVRGPVRGLDAPEDV